MAQKKTQVKTFKARSSMEREEGYYSREIPQCLEDEVNNWMKSTNFEIMDVKYGEYFGSYGNGMKFMDRVFLVTYR